MGARAFIPVTLAGAILLSLAPATPAAAEEPTIPVLVDPGAPTVDPVVDPTTDLTPPVDPVVVDPTPAPLRSSPIRPPRPRRSWPRS